MTDTSNTSASSAADEDDDERAQRTTKRRRLSDEELRNLEQTAQPGAVYREVDWSKRAREDLTRIERAIDQLEAPGGSATAIARKRRARESELPGGLRSRITEALGPVAYVQLSYSTREHHVCHVGLRSGDGIEDVIVLVGPDDVRAFEQIQDAIDALQARTHPGTEPEGPEPFGRVYEVEDIEGIGEQYTSELEAIGIQDTRALWHADTPRVASELDVSPKTVALWQQMAELMAISGIGPQYAELLARSGVDSIETLASADAATLLDEIDSKQEDLLVKIQGNVIREERVRGWIEKARAHAADQG